MAENKPKPLIRLISEVADFCIVRNWKLDRFGFPKVICRCPNCGYEFSEKEIRNLATVEFNDEKVVLLEDLKSAIQGLLQEIEQKEREVNTSLSKILEGKKKDTSVNRGALYGWGEALFWAKEKIKKWFPDIFKKSEENGKE